MVRELLPSQPEACQRRCGISISRSLSLLLRASWRWLNLAVMHIHADPIYSTPSTSTRILDGSRIQTPKLISPKTIYDLVTKKIPTRYA